MVAELTAVARVETLTGLGLLMAGALTEGLASAGLSTNPVDGWIGTAAVLEAVAIVVTLSELGLALAVAASDFAVAALSRLTETKHCDRGSPAKPMGQEQTAR